MTARKTKLDDTTARAIADACGVRPFYQRGYIAKDVAQNNLSGKSHYAEDDTLKFFHARINRCYIECNGLVLVIVESAAKDMNNASRGHRFVAFDLFGTVINERERADEMHSTSDKALADMRTFLDGFNVLAHYKDKLAERAARAKREADAMAKAARAIKV